MLVRGLKPGDLVGIRLGGDRQLPLWDTEYGNYATAWLKPGRLGVVVARVIVDEPDRTADAVCIMVDGCCGWNDAHYFRKL